MELGTLDFIELAIDAVTNEIELFEAMTVDLSEIIQELEGREDEHPLYQEIVTAGKDLLTRTGNWNEVLERRILILSAAFLEIEYGVRIGEIAEIEGGKILVHETTFYRRDECYSNFHIRGVQCRKDGTPGKRSAFSILPHDESGLLKTRRQDEEKARERELEERILKEYFGLSFGDDLSFVDKNFGRSKLRIENAKLPYRSVLGRDEDNSIEVNGPRYRDDGSLGTKIISTKLTFIKRDRPEHILHKRDKNAIALAATTANISSLNGEPDWQDIANNTTWAKSVEKKDRTGWWCWNSPPLGEIHYIELAPFSGTPTGEIGEFLKVLSRRVGEGIRFHKTTAEALFFRQTGLVVGDELTIGDRKILMTEISVDAQSVTFTVHGLPYLKGGKIGKRVVSEELPLEAC
ncbi:hypothetical protein GEOBRER4_n3731 [Citrifermentans bremense]|uniref:Uncharacterized protein n=1 Tax=Citrifermentans bremense TaxID=60035 RepID=A0A6S6M359_9BACT|nr:hypothetical protein [Citrifermentans bremense]BCG48837.1 hypothetical protein GEOBRER4_n3731 [Citrifermentans bremense]